MDHRMTAMERAFQLARSGQVAEFSEIVEALRRERYSVDQLQGPMLRRQLVDLIKTARARERLTSPPPIRRMTSP
jgi:hypothetical protein